MECIICLTDSDDFQLCKNFIICKSVYCDSCYNRLIEICLNENIVPKCPNISCKLEIYYSEIKQLGDKAILQRYSDVMADSLIYTKKEEIEENTILDTIKSNSITDRMNFVNAFPLTIQMIINISLSDKLQKIKKSYIENQYNTNYIKVHGRCFNSLCDGKLRELNHKGVSLDELKCVKCGNVYCMKCHQLKSAMFHQCKQSDIDSVEHLKSFTKCPECEIPVEKINGCNNATCPNCKTNFCFRTGKRTSAGNHDHLTLNINLKEYKLSKLYEKEYDKDIIDKLIEIENNKPKMPVSLNQKLIKRIISHKNDAIVDHKNTLKISKLYEKFMIKMNVYQLYISNLKKIEQIHIKERLTLGKLNDL